MFKHKVFIFSSHWYLSKKKGKVSKVGTYINV